MRRRPSSALTSRSGNATVAFVSPDTLKREAAIEALAQAAQATAAQTPPFLSPETAQVLAQAAKASAAQTPPFLSPETAQMEAAIEALAQARETGAVEDGHGGFKQVAISPEPEPEGLQGEHLTWSAGLKQAVIHARGSPTPPVTPMPPSPTVGHVDSVLCTDGVMRYTAQLRPLHLQVYAVPRRYTEWASLRQRLVDFGVQLSTAFPGKHLWLSPCDVVPCGRHDPAVVRARTVAFHAWTDELLRLEGVLDLPEVRDFFALADRPM